MGLTRSARSGFVPHSEVHPGDLLRYVQGRSRHQTLVAEACEGRSGSLLEAPFRIVVADPVDGAPDDLQNAERSLRLHLSGRSDEACGTVEALLREMPRFSCNFARHKLFYLKRVGQIEMYLQGLREAGVPED